MSLDKYNDLFTRAYNMEATNKFYSDQLYKQAEEEMQKYLSTPRYTTSNNNNQHYQYNSGGTPNVDRGPTVTQITCSNTGVTFLVNR